MKGLKLLKTSVYYNFYIYNDGGDSRQFLISCDMDGHWVETKIGIDVVSYNSDFGAD
jgi:hypothetical protein